MLSLVITCILTFLIVIFAEINLTIMSNFHVYIHLEPFVRQWLVNSFGEPVEFPAQSVENAVIRTCLAKQPAVPEKHDDDDIAICIPYSKAKDPRTWNHLTAHGKKALVEVIEDNFKLNLWTELNDLSNLQGKVSVTTIIYSWCEVHGINIDYADTIRQRYNRIRKSYTNAGIDMMKHTRVHDKE